MVTRLLRNIIPQFDLALACQIGNKRYKYSLPFTKIKEDVIKVDSKLEKSRGEKIDVNRYFYGFRTNNTLDALEMKVNFKIGESFTECFYPYNDLASGFPLPQGKGKKISLTNESISAETYTDIKGDRRVIFFYEPGKNLVFGILDKVEMSKEKWELYQGAKEKNFNLAFKYKAKSLSADETKNALFKIITYIPEDKRFWWQDGMEYADKTGISQLLFRISLNKRSYHEGENCGLYILGCQDKKMKVTLHRVGLDNRISFSDELIPDKAVYKYSIDTAGWKSGLYWLTVTSNFAKRDTLFVIRPRKVKGEILFIVATNAWRSYAMNGHYHGSIDHIYPWSYSYSATLLEGISDIESDVPKCNVYPLQRFYYNNMPSGFARTTEGLVLALDEFEKSNRIKIDYCAEEDIHFSNIQLLDYKLVIMDNHAEYSTEEELKKIEEFVNSKGRFLIIGGDSFGRNVEYIMEDNGIKYQYLHGSTVSFAKPYPLGSQRTDEQRLKRFGLTYVASPPFQKKCPIVIENNSHPITQGYKIGEVISETRWEGDRLSENWDILAKVYYEKRDAISGSTNIIEFPSLAINKKNMVYFGPMGIAETLANYYGNREKIKKLFYKILNYLLNI